MEKPSKSEDNPSDKRVFLSHKTSNYLPSIGFSLSAFPVALRNLLLQQEIPVKKAEAKHEEALGEQPTSEVILAEQAKCGWAIPGMSGETTQSQKIKSTLRQEKSMFCKFYFI